MTTVSPRESRAALSPENGVDMATMDLSNEESQEAEVTLKNEQEKNLTQDTVNSESNYETAASEISLKKDPGTFVKPHSSVSENHEIKGARNQRSGVTLAAMTFQTDPGGARAAMTVHASGAGAAPMAQDPKGPQGKDQSPEAEAVPSNELEMTRTILSFEAGTAEKTAETRAAMSIETMTYAPTQTSLTLETGTRAGSENPTTRASITYVVSRTPPGPYGPGPDHVGGAGAGTPDSNPLLVSAEGTYLRSVTSLLGGGEGPIRSLSDILVWTETAVGRATGFLEASRTSMSDLLHGTGTALRSMTSLLGEASSAFTSGLVNGTGRALRSVTHLLDHIEQRTMEGIRNALRYMTDSLSPSNTPGAADTN
ncbi:testis-expressed protein 44 [Ornithorhynchus anatinus]|uniref:testis-expressed protein 44 n=1 Tax=Ornithorhynchus anatinus TaxID=9258 RepID=UPI0010A75AA8|nr:testis-expressed protein 44 [Ornithorhynchus anatinus]